MTNHRNYIPRRKFILAKARKALSEQGYHQTTMKDIGRACGFEASNVYNYFPSKEALLFEVLRDEMDILLSKARPLLDDQDANPVDQLKFMVRHHIHTLLKARRANRAVFETEFRYLRSADKQVILSMRDEFENILREIIRRGTAKGYFVKCDVKIAAFNILAMAVRTRSWYKPSGKLSIDGICDNIAKFAIDALTPHK